MLNEKAEKTPNHEQVKMVADMIKRHPEVIASLLEGSNGEIHTTLQAGMDQALMSAVLIKTRGNQTRAALMYGINRSTFRKRLKLQKLA